MHKRGRTRFFRCNSDKSHKSVRCALKSPKNFRITGDDIPLILRTFFCLADKWAFHIDTDQIRLSLRLFPYFFRCVCRFFRFRLFPIGSCHRKNMFQFRHRKRHCRRCDRRHTDRRLIPRDLPDCLLCPIAEIISHAAVKMKIDHTRNRIAARTVQNFFLCLRFCISGKNTVPDTDLAFFECLVFLIYLYIFNNHLPSLHTHPV